MSTTATVQTASGIESEQARETTAGGFGWIISPIWDLLYFVAAPILIVPAVLAARWWFTNEAIWLVVMSFCSLGHHLPGFLRAYGESELRTRFRWRLLLVPPAVFATAWYFQSQGLHGLKVLILLWAYWHGLMQTYGFMRIYDLKRGRRDPQSARLDFWLCVTIFAAGIVFSGPRMFGILQAVWESGLPVFDAGWINLIQWVVGGSTLAVLTAYVVHLVINARRGLGVTWNKVLLAGGTAFIWWFCGLVVTDILIGVAIFEVLHAVQYLAIVWVFQRKKTQQLGETAGRPWRLLFRDRRLLLLAYLGLIAAFGSLRYMQEGVLHPGWVTLFGSLLATSTILHYYFDGFIWKVRERANQQHLDIRNSGDRLSGEFVSGLVHAGKWALFVLPAAALIGSEALLARQDEAAQRQRQMQVTEQLSRVAPTVLQAQMLRADAALAAGDRSTALDAYGRAIELAPENADLQFNVAGVLAAQDRWEESEAAYLRVLELDPAHADARDDLASLYATWGERLATTGDYALAQMKLELALSLRPEWPEVAYSAARNAQLANASAAAIRLYERYLELAGDVLPGATVLWSGSSPEALTATSHYQLASLIWQRVQPRLRLGRPALYRHDVEAAREHLLAAREFGYPIPPAMWGQLERVRRQRGYGER